MYIKMPLRTYRYAVAGIHGSVCECWRATLMQSRSSECGLHVVKYAPMKRQPLDRNQHVDDGGHRADRLITI